MRAHPPFREDARRHLQDLTRPTYRLHVVAAGVGLGIAVASGIDLTDQPPLTWPWRALAIGAGAAAILLRAHRRTALACLVVGAFGLGGARWAHVMNPPSANHLSRAIGDAERAIVRVRGRIVTAPEQPPRRGSLARFSFRPPRWRFELDVAGFLDERGDAHEATGRVIVFVNDEARPPPIGAAVEIVGMFTPPRPPRNPGAGDPTPFVRATNRAGAITVKTTDGVRTLATPSTWRSRLHRLRADVRSRARGRLIGVDPTTSALTAALVLGVRESAADPLDDAFRRAGVAHLLAISGLHVGIVSAAVLSLLRTIGCGRRPAAIVGTALIVAYLLVVEPRAPVVRAGLLAIIVGLDLAFGQRRQVSSLIALLAVFLIWRRPEQLFLPGFQLTFLVVFALIHLGPAARTRWFGPPDALAATRARIMLEHLKTAAALAIVAQLVSTPVILFHFGMITPYAPIVTILAAPVTAGVLMLGFARLLLGGWLGVLVDPAAEVLIGLVGVADGLPGGVILLPPPGPVWTLVTLGAMWLALRTWSWDRLDMIFSPARRRARLSVTVVFGWCVVWLVLSPRGLSSDVALRIDMFHVGDGSCYLVRTGGRTVMYDAGSTGDPNLGRAQLAPALRALGVTRIDAVIISHPNLDHFSAVLDIADQIPVDAVQMTRQMRAAGDRGATRALIAGLRTRGVPIVDLTFGHGVRIGASTWTWLHPPPAAAYEEANDASIVLAIDAAGRRVLFTGDIQRLAMRDLLRQENREQRANLRADVLELPHHGSFNDMAAAFVEVVDPAVVLQSTGRQRLDPDAWATRLAGRTRFVTARDGAAWIEIRSDGVIRGGTLADRRSSP